MNAETVRMLADGDLSAVQQCLSLVMRWLTANAGESLPFADREDIASDTVQRAAVAAPDFRSASKPETWLISIAKRALADHFRHRGRHAPSAVSLEELPVDTSGNTDVALLVTRQVAADLAMEALSPDEKEAIRFCIEEGLSSAQAGGRMNRPASTIRSLVRRGLAKARAVLADLDDPENVSINEVRDDGQASQ